MSEIRTLIVDDSSVMRKIVERSLRQAGLEFLRQIRAQNLAPGVPVVMITTESSEEHVKQAILAGAQGYIRKPFTAEQVKERVLPLLNAA